MLPPDVLRARPGVPPASAALQVEQQAPSGSLMAWLGCLVLFMMGRDSALSPMQNAATGA